jgi:hypothetical protein
MHHVLTFGPESEPLRFRLYGYPVGALGSKDVMKKVAVVDERSGTSERSQSRLTGATASTV